MLDWNAQVLAARVLSPSFHLSFLMMMRSTRLFPNDPAQGDCSPNVITYADHAALFHPVCFRSNDISTIAMAFQDPTLIDGYFDHIIAKDGKLTLSGWACLPPQRLPANAVLLTTPDKEGVERIFAIAGEAHLVRYDVANAMNCKALDRSGWTKTINADQLHHGAVVSAWAYDTYGRRAYKLEASQVIP